MKSFACGTVVPGCDGVVTGETEEDVMAAAAAHADTGFAPFVNHFNQVPITLVFSQGASSAA